MKKRAVSLLLTLGILLTACNGGKTVTDDTSSEIENTEATSSEEQAGEKTGAENKETDPAETDGTEQTSKTTFKEDEGIEGTGAYNYGEALQKSLLFYELQRSGDLPDETRCNWRADSGMDDGKAEGVDLTGGLYDAGDHVKFNLPMAYTASLLAWSVYEDRDAYETSGQLEYALGDIKWICDYLIKCHTEDEVFWYQVGDGGIDHSWWGPCEVMTMNRPAYKVTHDQPGSAVVGEAAAALAAASLVFEKTDKAYSEECLKHAKSLYKFADSTRSDAGYTAANGFYDSWSGFYDELAFAGAWLNIATGDDSYLKTAEECFKSAGHDFDWSLCWDDVHIGAAVLLSKITEKQEYADEVGKHLDFWTCGTSDGKKITYTPKGLAWLDSWGSLRYATTTGFVAELFGRSEQCPKDKSEIYLEFAKTQADYALGSSGRSFMIGFGENSPVHPHHRTSQGSYSNNMGEPSDSRHVLIGALVGGPDQSDNYTDTVNDYCANEVACDYNAGFTGLLAALYSEYHGKTIKGLTADEVPGEEYSCECSINASGDDFTEIKGLIYNKTAWPARAAEDLEFRYFVDLSEVYEAGGSVDSIKITTNYIKSGEVAGLKPYNEADHIYYLSVVFNDGTLYPGGQDAYKSEIQVRMQNPGGAWDASNDPSGISGGVLLENGEIVYGTMPDGKTADKPEPTSAADAKTTTTPKATPTEVVLTQETSGYSMDPEELFEAQEGDFEVKVHYDVNADQANSISGTIDITNKSATDIDLSTLNVLYYLTNDGGSELTFDCYHAATMSMYGLYTAMTDHVSAKIEDVKKDDCDTCVKISFGTGYIQGYASLTIGFSIHRTDWQNMDVKDDRSYKSVENIVITSGDKTVFGKEP